MTVTVRAAEPIHAEQTEPPRPGSADPPVEDAEQASPTAKPGANPPPKPTEPPIDSDDEREPVDYDGREEPTTAGDVLIWIPRILLSPLYLVSEFVVRRPIGALATVAEKHHWPEKLVDFFTFGPRRNGGFVPTFFFDFGFQPSLGVYFFWDDAFFRNNEIRARLSTGGPEWFRVHLVDRVRVRPDETLGLEGDYLLRPDFSFWGVGPVTPTDEVRFGAEALQGAFAYDADLWRSSALRAATGVRTATFDSSQTAFSDPSIDDALASGRLNELPDGFVDGYTIAFSTVSAALDTRPRRQLERKRKASDFVPPPRSGVRIAADGELATGLEQARRVPSEEPVHLAWVRYGASVGGFADLTGLQRVLGLSVITDFADPLIDESFVPFTELPSLGGDRPMRGFRSRRLIDRSAIVGSLDYQWPIWIHLDGHMNFSVGNVFGRHLDGFEMDLLRGSAELGVRTIASPDHPFELLVGFGTEPFREGFSVDQVRFLIGSPSSFWRR